MTHADSSTNRDANALTAKAKQELNDYNRVLAILERNPEMSDITLSVLTGVKQKEILAKARQTLDSSWYRRLRQAYFTVDSRKLSEDEQIRLQQLMVRLVKLAYRTTWVPDYPGRP